MRQLKGDLEELFKGFLFDGDFLYDTIMAPLKQRKKTVKTLITKDPNYFGLYPDINYEVDLLILNLPTGKASYLIAANIITDNILDRTPGHMHVDDATIFEIKPDHSDLREAFEELQKIYTPDVYRVANDDDYDFYGVE